MDEMNIEEVAPEKEECETIQAYLNRDPEYEPAATQEELIIALNLYLE